MKDAKGHGSDPGAHSAGVTAMSKTAFADLLAQTRARIEESRGVVEQALAGGNPHLVMTNGSRKIALTKSLDPNYAYRVTNFDDQGPVGHREYGANSVHQVQSEISQALSSGYKVRK